LWHREYVRERKIKVESRRQRTKSDSRLRDDAGDPVARPRDELATAKLLGEPFKLGLRSKLQACGLFFSSGQSPSPHG
jgi:hypothetical protein